MASIKQTLGVARENYSFIVLTNVTTEGEYHHLSERVKYRLIYVRYSSCIGRVLACLTSTQIWGRS